MDLAQRSLRERFRTNLIRPLWSRLLRWRVGLLYRHRHERPVLECVADRPILVLPTVFNPRLFRTGAFLAESLDSRLIPAGAIVLDMGTGSGVGAIVAAAWAERVVGVDINAEAVRCARINALLNDVDACVDVRQGDLFEPVHGETFDVVLFNPPFFRGTPRDAFDYAWRSDDTVERFAAGLSAHLSPGGHALVILSTDGEAPAFLRSFRDNGFAVTAIAERDFVNEVLTVYRLQEHHRGT